MANNPKDRDRGPAAFLPATPEPFTYDDDGNVTHDSEWDYTWDAENRLVLMEHRSEVVGTGMLANADKRRIEFRYDYQSRRVRKTVYGGWNGTSFNAIPLSDTKYLYDGWNLVAEFSVGGEGALTLARSYTWGLDLIGSLTASGGVGALLQIHDHAAGKTLLPAYDGNGNVVALLNDTSGDLEAVYDYSPFGKLVRSTGTYAEANAFRFSTKFTDSETGLVYYGLRYYSPTLGRFLGRDPIEESGGVNLYAFVGNNAVNAWDYLGMDPIYEYGYGGVPFEVLNYDQVWASVWYGVSPTNQNWSVGDNLLAARLGEQRGQMENYDRGTGFDANGPMFGQTSFFSDDKYAPVISHAEATFRWGNSVSGGDQLKIDSRNDTILSINGWTQGGTVTLGPIVVMNEDALSSVDWGTAFNPSPGGPSALVRLTEDDRRQGMINSSYRAPQPFEAIMAAGRETFGNAVFQQPLTTLATAGVQVTALVGTAYAGVIYAPAALTVARSGYTATRVATQLTYQAIVSRPVLVAESGNFLNGLFNKETPLPPPTPAGVIGGLVAKIRDDWFP